MFGRAFWDEQDRKRIMIALILRCVSFAIILYSVLVMRAAQRSGVIGAPYDLWDVVAISVLVFAMSFFI